MTIRQLSAGIDSLYWSSPCGIAAPRMAALKIARDSAGLIGHGSAVAGDTRVRALGRSARHPQTRSTSSRMSSASRSWTPSACLRSTCNSDRHSSTRWVSWRVVAWPSPTQHLVLGSLAEAIGGRALARMGGREHRGPEVMHRSGTETIIINNSHMLEWRGAEELIDLHDVFEGKFGFSPAFVFSGIGSQQLQNLSRRPEIADQFHRRIRRRTSVNGHDREETKTAIALLMKRYDPLFEEPAARASGLVFELLTKPETDTTGTGYVGTGDLVELVRRVLAIRAIYPEAEPADTIRKAYQVLLHDRAVGPRLPAG